MCQQTQVSRVVPVYLRFLSRFPTPDACARAAVGDVVRAWAGLGYNRRAVNLHRAAQALVDRHGGRVPDTLTALRALPGVGDYTARAVLAFAAEAEVGVLDTNSGRVLARTAGRRLAKAEAQCRADGLVPPGRSWAWNSALLDLGSELCTSRAPRCDACPVSATAGACAWYEQGRPEPDPAWRSGGTSAPQSTFAGSDRQGRGRLVAALRAGPVPLVDLGDAAGWPADPDRARRAAEGLVADGLAVTVTIAGRASLSLPA